MQSPTSCIAAALLFAFAAAASADETPLPIHAPGYDAGKFQPRKALDNYYGLPSPEGGTMTAEAMQKLSPRARTLLLTFSNFPENVRVQQLKGAYNELQDDQRSLARAEAEGRSPEAFLGLKLSDGTVVTEERLRELSPRGRGMLAAFAKTPETGRVRIADRVFQEAREEVEKEQAAYEAAETENKKSIAALAEKKKQADDRAARDKQREEERAAKRAAQEAKQSADREALERERAQEAAAHRAKQEAEAQERRDQEAANQLLRKAEQERRDAERDAQAALNVDEQNARYAAEAERRQDENRRNLEEATAIANDPSRRLKINRGTAPMSMEQFRREHMPEREDGGRFRITGRAVKGLLGLGLLLIMGLIAGVRMLFRSGANDGATQDGMTGAV